MRGLRPFLFRHRVLHTRLIRCNWRAASNGAVDRDKASATVDWEATRLPPPPDPTKEFQTIKPLASELLRNSLYVGGLVIRRFADPKALFALCTSSLFVFAFGWAEAMAITAQHGKEHPLFGVMTVLTYG